MLSNNPHGDKHGGYSWSVCLDLQPEFASADTKNVTWKHVYIGRVCPAGVQVSVECQVWKKLRVDHQVRQQDSVESWGRKWASVLPDLMLCMKSGSRRV